VIIQLALKTIHFESIGKNILPVKILLHPSLSDNISHTALYST